MLTPFPEDVPVAYGLVNVRTVWQVPIWIFGLLFVAGIGPLYLGGKRYWWASVICLGLGCLVAKVAKDDPQFAASWAGEMRLSDSYD